MSKLTNVCLTTCFAASAIAAGARAEDQPSSAKARPPRVMSLDEQLLEDLSPPPSKLRASDQEAKKDAAQKQKSMPETPSLDEELLEGLEGEDILTQADENPLMRVNQRMRQVERRIAAARGDEKTQRMQHEISDDLSKLIAQFERQCSQCKKPSSASARPQSSQTKPGTTPAEQAANNSAQDSTRELKDKSTAKVDRQQVREMLKDFWGHLPPHLRQQIEQSANEEFLPKYEMEIAEYYRSLLRSREEK